jgi:hypothetical protein
MTNYCTISARCSAQTDTALCLHDKRETFENGSKRITLHFKFPAGGILTVSTQVNGDLLIVILLCDSDEGLHHAPIYRFDNLRVVDFDGCHVGWVLSAETTMRLGQTTETQGGVRGLLWFTRSRFVSDLVMRAGVCID